MTAMWTNKRVLYSRTTHSCGDINTELVSKWIGKEICLQSPPVLWKCGRMCIGLVVVRRLTHAAESAVSEPRASEVQMATEWMHLHFVGTDHTDRYDPANRLKVYSEIHTLKPTSNKNELYERWKKSIKIFNYNKCEKLTAASTIQQRHHCHQRHT